MLDESLGLTSEVFFASGWATALIVALAAVAGLVAYQLCMRVLVRRQHGGGRRADKLVGWFFAACAATLVLVFPLFFCIYDGDLVAAIAIVPFRVLQAVVIDNGFVDFVKGSPVGMAANLYFSLLGIMYILLPVLAISNVVDLLQQRMAEFRTNRVIKRTVRDKNVFLFSDFNRKSIGLAKDILDSDGAAHIVFGSMSKLERDTWGTEMGELGDLRVEYLEMDYSNLAVRLCDEFRFSTLNCFAISDDYEKNVSDTCQTIASLRARQSDGVVACEAFLDPSDADQKSSRVRLYALYDSPEAELVIDAANGRDRVEKYAVPQLQVITLREATLAAFSLLDEAPLFRVFADEPAGDDGLKPAEPQGLDVVVVGSGSVAEEVVKACLWCGQMHRITLRVHVADDEADVIDARMRSRYPGIWQGEDARFSLSFNTMRVQSSEFAEGFLGRFVESENLYVVVAVDGDALAHEVAMRTRLFFLNNGKLGSGKLGNGKLGNGKLTSRSKLDVSPFIACHIRDEAMSNLINKQFDESVPGFGIWPFGCSGKLLSYQRVVGSPLERVGQVASDIYNMLYDGVYAEAEKGSFGKEDVDAELLRQIVADKLGSSDIGRMLYDAGLKHNGIACKGQLIYNSNLALAMHIRYKAWAIGLDATEDAAGESVPVSALVQLGRVEHDRWVVFHQSQGYSFLSESEQERYSRLLQGDNCRRKIDPFKLHTLMCSNEDIWKNYVHACSGFEYEEASQRASGSAVVEVEIGDVPENAKIPREARIQLLDSEYRVVDSWDASARGGETRVHKVERLGDGAYIVHPAFAFEGHMCASDVTFQIRGGKLASGDGCGKLASGDGGGARIVVECKGDPLVNPVIYDWAFAFATPYFKELLDCRNVQARQLVAAKGSVYRKKAGLRGFTLIYATDESYGGYNGFEDVLYSGKGHYVQGLAGEQWKVSTIEHIAQSYVVDGLRCGFAEDGAEINGELMAVATRYAAENGHGDTPAKVTVPIRYRDSNSLPILALRAPDTIKSIELESSKENGVVLKVNGERDRFGKRIKHGPKGRQDVIACQMREVPEGVTEGIGGGADCAGGAEGGADRAGGGDGLWRIDGKLYQADLAGLYVINGVVFDKTYDPHDAAEKHRRSAT